MRFRVRVRALLVKFRVRVRALLIKFRVRVRARIRVMARVRIRVRVRVLPSTWNSGCVRIGGERRVSGYELTRIWFC